jgi:NACHT domain
VLLLFVGATAVSLALAYFYRLGVAQSLIAVLVGGGAPAGLYLAWAAYRDDRRHRSQAGPSLAEVADQFAVAVGAQWQAETAVQRLNEPYPLPVSWAAADESLADPWHVLVRLATSGAGWPSPRLPVPWAAGAGGLAGDGGDLVRVLARVPTGRLVVLGEPGSGKTVLMIRLVLDLLARRRSGEPVPVLVSLASWNPDAQDLPRWLTAQLTLDYPALAVPAPQGAGTRAAALLAAGLILPVLDGLDEVPDALRGRVITQINDALRPGEHAVVTCRTSQYQLAARSPGGAKAILAGAAAVQLRSLDAGTVARYLVDDAGGPAAAARWEPVLATLGTQSPVGQALATPLMVGLARTIYIPRADERGGKTPDPADLCRPALADRGAVEAHLFDGLIPAAYRRGLAGRWTALEAATWLAFLARHLERPAGGPDLAWWQLTGAVHLRLLKLGIALAVGLITAVAAGLAFPDPGVAELGAVPALALALPALFRGPRQPSRGVRFRILRFAGGLMAGLVLVAGPAVATAATVNQGSHQTSSGSGWRPILDALADGFAHALLAALFLFAGLVLGLGAALMIALILGLQSVPGDLRSAASPRAVLARDRRAALVLACSAVLGIMFVFALAFGIVGGPVAALYGLVAGLAFGLETAILISAGKVAWPSYLLACAWLALRRRLPWRLMDFLADAHRRGILRQAGPVYQFRHIELQHHLAGQARPRLPVPGAPAGARGDAAWPAASRPD